MMKQGLVCLAERVLSVLMFSVELERGGIGEFLPV